MQKGVVWGICLEPAEKEHAQANGSDFLADIVGYWGRGRVSGVIGTNGVRSGKGEENVQLPAGTEE